MKRNGLFKSLPPNLSLKEICNLVKDSGYEIRKERRSRPIPNWVNAANWKLPNIDIANRFKITRESVRKWRIVVGAPKVESRGRHKKKH